MKPTPAKHFENNALHPATIALIRIDDAERAVGKVLSVEDKSWFVLHADSWLRWFHANRKDWRKKLERGSEQDRNHIRKWVFHWALAFVQDPEAYKTQHPLSSLV